MEQMNANASTEVKGFSMRLPLTVATRFKQLCVEKDLNQAELIEMLIKHFDETPAEDRNATDCNQSQELKFFSSYENSMAIPPISMPTRILNVRGRCLYSDTNRTHKDAVLFAEMLSKDYGIDVTDAHVIINTVSITHLDSESSTSVGGQYLLTESISIFDRSHQFELLMRNDWCVAADNAEGIMSELSHYVDVAQKMAIRLALAESANSAADMAAYRPSALRKE